MTNSTGPQQFDVAILGAGAAGLMAAIRAAERGLRVVLLEKNRRPGVKILMSGGTRCNITNARGLHNFRVVSGPIDANFDTREARGHASIQSAFGPNGPFLRHALRAFATDDCVRFFEAEGVATKVEANGKIFPVSDRAADVLQALVNRLDRSGVTLLTNHPARAVAPNTEGGFLIDLPDKALRAAKVIVAVGGQSFPGCGTTGDGYAIARAFGHSVVEPKPALVPVRTSLPWIAELKGITLPRVRVSALDSNSKVLAERLEAVLFAHFGLTGPAILDVSRAFSHSNPNALPQLRLDLLPNLAATALDAELASAARRGRTSVQNLIPDEIPRRLVHVLLDLCHIAKEKPAAELARDERKQLVSHLKALTIHTSGTLGFEKAEVTAGGVALAQVNPDTLESLHQPGLYFCGEVLDLDGLIGGYNFQAAWSTGWLAGGSV